MGKLFGWRSLAVLTMAACSGENISAPGVCPQFCAAVNVQAIDTVMRAIQGDSTYTGYVPASKASQIMVTSPSAMVESRAVFRFSRFSDTIPLNTGDTTTRTVVQTDSFRLMLVLNRRTVSVSDLKYVLYRLPWTVDSTSPFAALAPYFADSTFIRDYPVQDTSASDSVFIPFDPAAFPTFAADSGNVAIGVALRSASPAFVELGTTEALRGAVLSRWVKVDSVLRTDTSAAVRVDRESPRATVLDTYVFPPLPPLGTNELSIGSAPSSRSIVRLNISKQIVDSSNVVRATLFLVPTGPVIGAPGDTLRIVPNALATDLGAKSPVRAAVIDSAGRLGAKVVPGWTDTIKVDITDAVRSWKGDTLSARALTLRLDKEGGSFGQVRFWSTLDLLRKPVLDITYVPQVNYEGR